MQDLSQLLWRQPHKILRLQMTYQQLKIFCRVIVVHMMLMLLMGELALH